MGRAKLNSWIRTLAANLAVTYVARPVVTWIIKRMMMRMMNKMMIDDLGLTWIMMILVTCIPGSFISQAVCL